MVLAAIGEELGFLGLLAVLGLYAVLVSRGLRAARRAGGAYGFFLALGPTLLLALQVLLIAGGVLGLVPLSGVVSPFLSSGWPPCSPTSCSPGSSSRSRPGAAKWAAPSPSAGRCAGWPWRWPCRPPRSPRAPRRSRSSAATSP